MNHAQSDEINFWPAYVDALINVVLNLLFLVGVFTIGLVSLNEQAFIAEKEATRRKLASLESAKSVQERQEIAGELLRSLPVMPKVTKIEQPQITEIRFKSDVKIKSASEAEQASLTTANITSLDQFTSTLAKGGELTRITFEPNQYIQPAEWTWPEEIKPRASEKNWSLFVFADPSNARLSREAYARLLYVRNVLLKAGALPGQIQMKVTPAPDAIALPLGNERNVWVVERTR